MACLPLLILIESPKETPLIAQENKYLGIF